MAERTRRRSAAFVVAVLLVGYGLLSAGVAIATIDDCDQATGGRKHWVLLPPGWECGEGSVEVVGD